MIVVATIFPTMATAEPHPAVTTARPANDSAEEMPPTEPDNTFPTGPQTGTPSGEVALPWRNYVFERESRALAKMVNIAPWTAARLLAEDPDVRERAPAALDARQNRKTIGTGLLIGGLVLTLAGLVMTAVSGDIHQAVTHDPDSGGPSASLMKALGTGIGFLSLGVILDATAIGALTGLTDEERDFRSWLKNR